MGARWHLGNCLLRAGVIVMLKAALVMGRAAVVVGGGRPKTTPGDVIHFTGCCVYSRRVGMRSSDFANEERHHRRRREGQA